MFIRFFDLDETVNLLIKRLTILPTSKNASTIDLNLIDNMPGRGEDILVNFLTIFNGRQKNEKARNADSSIAFIDNRLNLLVNELDSVEQKIQSYRQNNELADVSAQRKLQLDNSSQNQNEASKYRVQLKAIDQLLMF